MKLATLLLTDVVDSTALAERLGDTEAAALWAEHDRLARALMAENDGHEIDRTDGFFVLFDDVAAAARFALGYHAAMAPLQLQARVALHRGAVTLRENPAEAVARGAKPVEVEGLAKPFAARVLSLASGGQTLLTEAARQALGVLPKGFETRSHGHYRLKGIEEPIEIIELGADAGCAFAPPADADKAYRVVREHELWRPLRETRHNLVPERDAFVGRTRELRALAQRLDAGSRLLTLVGPGGSGKTRLVRRYGLARLGDWPGGIYFCDLSEAKSLEGICFAVACALGVSLTKNDPVGNLGHQIAARSRCLLILDNFEQVVEQAAATLARWLDSVADASFIVTSRERLQLPGEEVFPVEPLPAGTDAVDLFAARASLHRPGFTLSQGNRAAVAEVARLLDGLPLAIELAAARIRVLSPQQLVARMKDRFALLAGARGAAARQATLRAAIDWSWELLSPCEQSALAQCAVFEGGFTMAAAEAVLDLSVWPEAPPVMDVVQALVDKSLLRAWVPFDQGRLDIEEPYFGMYLSIHEYAAERLGRSAHEVARQAPQRHGRYFAASGSDAAIAALRRHGGVLRQRELILEIDNLVLACRRAVARGDQDTAVATFRAAWAVFDLKGPGAVAAELAQQVCCMQGMAGAVRAQALVNRAWVSWRAGQVDEAATDFEQALLLCESNNDTRAAGRAHNSLGLLRHETGRHEQAQRCWDRALACASAIGDRWLEGSVLGHRGLECWKRGRPNEAQQHWEAAAVICREEGDLLGEGIVVGNLAMLCDEGSRPDEALALYDRALMLHRQAGNRRFEGIVFVNVGSLHAEAGRLVQAQENFDAALAIFREVGDRRGEGVVLGNLGRIALDRGQLVEAWAGLQAALRIHREVGNRSDEASVLGRLGDLLLKQRRVNEARQMLDAGEALLRELGHRLELASLLCARGRLDAALGNHQAAAAALDEALATAAALDMTDDSALGSGISGLREALAGSATR